MVKIKLYIGASNPPLSTSMKTGDWGTELAIVDEEKCIGCGQCVTFCPEPAVELVEKDEKKVAVVNHDYCKGCWVCYTVCPVSAIEMETKDIYKIEVC
ncbi:4Fe-4S dicluster-binding protein [Geoglobus acetivorans]|uniref:4Fe-4S binding protein n=1 Tax=Geoglobus acetivorans TaxID=565033 RepID=A0ABZ3H4K3_GEOAI|nr:4Fe-4S binding protein [Geoglobus acetivorans]